jgi:putative redox protein
MSHAQVSIGQIDYGVTITSGRHSLISDEPKSLGGQDAGPAPYDLLLASLGACTAITLRMYANRKQLALRSVHVNLRFIRREDGAHIDRVLTLDGDLTQEQRNRMVEIAEKTPVTLTLKAGTTIHTALAEVIDNG